MITTSILAVLLGFSFAAAVWPRRFVNAHQARNAIRVRQGLPRLKPLTVAHTRLVGIGGVAVVAALLSWLS